jgi:hypothetical protein
VQYADSGVDDVSAEIDEATNVSGGRRRDDGIAILEGVVTTEVPPDDEPPTADLDVPQPVWNQQVSGPRPVRAAPTGSAAAGERTSSGELPVSVTPPAWDSGPRRRTVRDLPPDVRLRMWRFRAIVVIVVGVVFTIVANWQVGLSLAILAGVIDTVYRSRTAADIEAGGSEAAARRRTKRQLARMRRAGYLALNARPIPNSREVIDHLVVGPTGVYAIDSERWHKRVPIRTYNGKQLWHGPENKKARLEHANWEAQQASERLSTAVGFDVPVRAAMAIYGPKIPWDIARRIFRQGSRHATAEVAHGHARQEHGGSARAAARHRGSQGGPRQAHHRGGEQLHRVRARPRAPPGGRPGRRRRGQGGRRDPPRVQHDRGRRRHRDGARRHAVLAAVP